ncbi:hypothetical protein SprV_0401505600 [Sparganum proliferum]
MLNQFHPSCLRRIIKLRWRGRILDTGILERTEILSINALRWRSYLVRMDDERLPRRFFCGNVVTGPRRKGDLVRRYKDTLNTSLRRLQINSVNWEDLIRNRPSWRRAVKAGSVTYEANRITAAKAECKSRRSQLSSTRNANARPPPTCPRCLLTFRAPIGLIGHLRTHCNTRTTPVDFPPSNFVSLSTPTVNTDRTPEPLTPSFIASVSAAASPVRPPTTAHNSDTSTNINSTIANTRDVDSVQTCLNCDRISTSHVPLVDHLQIHPTETGGPVPGAPTYSCRIRLHRPHRPRTFIHHKGPTRSHAHPRKPAVDNRRLHHTSSHRHLNLITPPPVTSTSHAGVNVLLDFFSMWLL